MIDLEQCLAGLKVIEEMAFSPHHFSLWHLLSSVVAARGSGGEKVQPGCEDKVSWIPMEEVTAGKLQTSHYLCLCSVV